jgi:hypothetical protein
MGRAAVLSAARPGVPAALLVMGWVLAWDRRISSHEIWSAGFFVLALISLFGPIARRGSLWRGGNALLMGLVPVLVIFSADRLLSAWENRAPHFSAVSTITSAILNIVGYQTSAERGLLLLEHPDGLVTMVPSIEKVAVRPFALFWIAWAALGLIGRPRFGIVRTTVGLGVVILGAIVRYVFLVAVYFEHDEILTAGAGQAALDLFVSQWTTGVFVLALGFVIDFVGKFVITEGPASVPPRARVLPSLWMGGALACSSWLAGFGWTFVPPGPEKLGRVLIDDRFCGIWEPTARQLDTEWYGDFPTYSFTSLAEWLGKWFSVDVNTSRAYDEKLLANYDVLVIKTPESAIPDRELEAIDRFVRGGGGLLLVGDHTNLLGMGTHLNAISAKYGIRFQYDSVSDGVTGGFVDYYGPKIGRPVGALHVDHLQFMTSCSLRISGDVEPLLAVDDCRREPHDYAGSSFFGRRGPHPEMEHGRTVLAAMTRVGNGRIAAFTDSTVWSSFAAFSYDREKLMMDLVRLLDREPSPWEIPLFALAIVATVIALTVAVAIAAPSNVLGPVAIGLGGFWLGVATADGLHRLAYAGPLPNQPVSEVTFLWQGGACAFPPVLGTPESLAADRSFDTLLVSVQRLGLVPRVAYTYDEDLFTPETRALFVVAPVESPPLKAMARIKSFVQSGGSLVVLDDFGFGERGSAKDFLALFEASITYHAAADHALDHARHVHVAGGFDPVKVPAADAFVARKLFGRGQVVYMSDAAHFSRQGLGHCFARPWKAARARYETIYQTLRDLLGIDITDRRYYGVL